MAQKNRYTKVMEDLKCVWPDFDLHMDDLNKPTVTFVCKFYEKLLAEVGVDIEKIKMTLTQHLSSPDAYQDILHCYVLYRCSSGFFERLQMKTVGEPFQISDILQPAPKLTKIRVMMIANFLFYASNLMVETLQPIESRLREELVEIDAMHKELDVIATETNIRAMEYAELEKEQEKIQEGIEETLQECAKQTQVHDTLLEAIEKRKKERNELEAEKARLMEIFKKEVAKKNELEQLVAEDHETILAERERIEKELAEEESFKTDHAINLDTKNDSEQKYNTLIAAVDEFLVQEPLESILELYTSQDTMKTSLERMKEEFQGLRTFQTDFHSTFQKMQLETDSLQEELQAIQVQLDVKQPILEQEVQLLETERDELTAKQKRNDQRTSELQQKIQLAEACCAQHERNMYELNEFNQREYKKILQNTSDLHNKVDRNLKEIKIKSEQIKQSFLPIIHTN